MVTRKIPDKWLDSGGTRGEYAIFKALYETGRKSGIDFIYQPGEQAGPNFVVFSPRVGIKVRPGFDPQKGLTELQVASAGIRVKVITEQDALSQPDRALMTALEGR